MARKNQQRHTLGWGIVGIRVIGLLQNLEPHPFINRALQNTTSVVNT